MKLFHRRRTEGGSALLVTLVITGTLGVALASYLTLVEHQHSSIVRSQAWNAALPASEAGVEEALTHLRMVGAGARQTNGWSASDGGAVLKGRGFGARSRFQVTISSNTQPTITAVGYHTLVNTTNEVRRTIRVTTTRTSGALKGLVAKYDVSMNGNTKVDSFDSTDPNYSTNGRYPAETAKQRDKAFVGSILGDITTGNGKIYGEVATGPGGDATGNVGDKSWHASHSGIQSGHERNDLGAEIPEVEIPSTANRWSPQVNAQVVITNWSFTTNSVTATSLPDPAPVNYVISTQQVTSATVPASGPYTTNFTATTSTTMPASGTYYGNVTVRNVVEGHGRNRTTVTYYDYLLMSYNFNAVTYTWSTIDAEATTETETFDYVLASGNYLMNSLSLSGQKRMFITGDAWLYVTGDVSISGQGQIIIQDGASLRLSVGGASASLSGNGVLNLTANAKKFTYEGLPTNTSLRMTGNASFTGQITAPDADVQLGGGGNDTYDCVGSMFGRTISLNGHFNFHYDEALGKNTSQVEYRVASWTEI